MKKQRFLVYTEYVFDGVFDVVAESKEEARQKVLQNCGLVMGGSIHSTLPDDEINWAFGRHPNKRVSSRPSRTRLTTSKWYWITPLFH